MSELSFLEILGILSQANKSPVKGSVSQPESFPWHLHMFRHIHKHLSHYLLIIVFRINLVFCCDLILINNTCEIMGLI